MNGKNTWPPPGQSDLILTLDISYKSWLCFEIQRMGVWRLVCMGFIVWLFKLDFLSTKHIVFQKQGLSLVGTSHIARLELGNIRLTDASDTWLGGLIMPQGLEEVRCPRARCCLVTIHLAGVELTGAWWRVQRNSWRQRWWTGRTEVEAAEGREGPSSCHGLEGAIVFLKKPGVIPGV